MKALEYDFSEEEKFELRLFISLKEYGYIFPTNIKDIQRFEDIYNNVDEIVPPHLNTLDDLLKEQSPDLNLNIKMAALHSRKRKRLDLPDDVNPESENTDDDDKK